MQNNTSCNFIYFCGYLFQQCCETRHQDKQNIISRTSMKSMHSFFKEFKLHLLIYLHCWSVLYMYHSFLTLDHQIVCCCKRIYVVLVTSSTTNLRVSLVSQSIFFFWSRDCLTWTRQFYVSIHIDTETFDFKGLPTKREAYHPSTLSKEEEEEKNTPERKERI